ncbi:MAG: hypothetical protein U9O89_05985 [Thermoproteota archaeon]|nr:hypothetical protein [Thermoproteota archaeon]
MYKALRKLGYHVASYEGKSEWRRRRFHLFIDKQGKRGVKLHIHKDYPGATMFKHRSRKTGKDLQQELDHIKETYRQIREESSSNKVKCSTTRGKKFRKHHYKISLKGVQL